MSKNQIEDRDALLASEAQLLINTFGAQNIDGLICRMQIRLQAPYNRRFMLTIDFCDYPYNPPKLSVPSMRKNMGNLFDPSFFLETIKNWNLQNPPHIVDVVKEFARKISALSAPPPELPSLNEEEILNKLEISIKNFFKERMNLEIEFPVIYCDTKEALASIYLSDLHPTTEVEKECFRQQANTAQGIFVSGKGIFMSMARYREMRFKTSNYYYYDMAEDLVHELIGHAFISEATDYGKLEKAYKLNVLNLELSPSIRTHIIIKNTVKFIHEGWATWISWFFRTQYDDPSLNQYLVPKNKRKIIKYPRDIKHFKGYLEAHLNFIQTGIFKFEGIKMPYSHEELNAFLQAKNISLETITSDFKRIISLLETVFQDFSDFSKENYNTILKSMWSLSDLDGIYSNWFTIIRYGIGFLLFKRIQEKYSTVCMPELLKLVLRVPRGVSLAELGKYYDGKYENWHDCKLALLLTVPVTPTMRINVEKCKEVVQHYLSKQYY